MRDTKEQMKRSEEKRQGAAKLGTDAERRACQIMTEECDYSSRAECVVLEIHQMCLLNSLENGLSSLVKAR